MKPRRWIWLGLGVVVGVLGTTGLRLLAQPPAGVGPDPTKAWQHRVMSVCAQFDRETSLSEDKARLGWEIAGEERRLNLLHASHERAATLWIGGEVYRNSLHDPASRQVYVQAAGTACQQHAQAIGAAYSTWAQAVGQTFQSWQSEGGASLQGVQTDNGAAWQSFAQAMPTHEGTPASLTWEDLQIPEAPLGPQTTDTEKALEEAMKKARTQYRTALQEATTAWQKATTKATKEHRDRALKDDEAASQLRKANRAWLTTALTALEDLRADYRSALRKHQLATTPE